MYLLSILHHARSNENRLEKVKCKHTFSARKKDLLVAIAENKKTNRTKYRRKIEEETTTTGS